MKIFRGILNWTWGIIQTLIGCIAWACIRLFSKKSCETFFWNGQPCTHVPGDWGGITLGWFTFVDDESLRSNEITKHEYGHTIQSAYWGPLWIFIFALPSLIWAGCFENYRKKHKISYYAFYTEKSANKLGCAYQDE